MGAVLITGVFVLLSGMIIQNLQHQYSRDREWEKVIRDKAEALVRALYRHGDWIDERQRLFINENKDHRDVDPLDEVLAIQRIYFQECNRNDLLSSVRALNGWFYDQRRAMLIGRDDWMAHYSERMAPFHELHGAYLARSREMMDAVIAAVDGEIESRVPVMEQISRRIKGSAWFRKLGL